MVCDVLVDDTRYHILTPSQSYCGEILVGADQHTMSFDAIVGNVV